MFEDGYVVEPIDIGEKLSPIFIDEDDDEDELILNPSASNYDLNISPALPG